MDDCKSIALGYKDALYAFTIEKSGTAESHVQGMIQFPSLIRQDNIRRAFVKKFQGIDEDERRHMVKVNTHNSLDVLIGYVQKENGYLETNIPGDVLQRSKELYDKMKRAKAQKPNGRLDIHDQVIDYMKEYCQELKIPYHYLTVESALTNMIRDKFITAGQYARIKHMTLEFVCGIVTGKQIGRAHV